MAGMTHGGKAPNHTGGPTMRRYLTCACVLLVTLCNLPQLQAGVSLTGLGYLPGGSRDSWAKGVSADGSVIVGWSLNANGTNEAFRWTRATGMVGLGLGAGGRPSDAYDVSSDGLVVVGAVQQAAGTAAFRWTQGTGMVTLPGLGGGEALANAVSADGSIAVGHVGNRASLWRPNLELLGGPMYGDDAFGVSADGSVVVGSVPTARVNEAVQWRDGTFSRLGYLPGGSAYGSANDVSHDGRVIVGYSHSQEGIEAFRWTEATGMVGLGDLPGGHVYGSATAVSADGSIVVGNSQVAYSRQEAFIWDQANGMRSLTDVLTGAGVNLDDWVDLHAYGISDDGRTIVGYGLRPSNRHEAWVATIEPIPEPASLLVWSLLGASGVGIGWWRRRRQAA